MNFFGVFLDNRELSFLIWGNIVLLLLLLKKDIRKSIFKILIILTNRNIILINIIMLSYVFVLIIVLIRLNFWDITLIKGTFLWIAFVAFPIFFKANKANQQKDYFKNLIKDNLKVILILEFLTNLYVFSLPIELIFIPFAVIIGGMSAVAETRKEYSSVKNIADYIVGTLGIITLIYVVYNIIYDFGSFANYENLNSFLLPIILTILFVPAIYFQALFINYESTFIRLKAFCRESSLLGYAKYKMITYSHLNLSKAKRFSKGISQINFNSKEELSESIKNL